jgi:hypothetical protein
MVDAAHVVCALAESLSALRAVGLTPQMHPRRPLAGGKKSAFAPLESLTTQLGLRSASPGLAAHIRSLLAAVFVATEFVLCVGALMCERLLMRLRFWQAFAWIFVRREFGEEPRVFWDDKECRSRACAGGFFRAVWQRRSHAGFAFVCRGGLFILFGCSDFCCVPVANTPLGGGLRETVVLQYNPREVRVVSLTSFLV